MSPSLAEIAQASAGKSPDAAYGQVVDHLFDRAGNNIALAKAGDGVTLVAHAEDAVVAGPIRSLAGDTLASASRRSAPADPTTSRRAAP